MKSMTGYSRKTFFIKHYGHITIEIKTVNSKGLNINCKLPNELYDIEHRIRKILSSIFRRGSIICSIRVDYSNEFIVNTMKKNIKKIEHIIKKLNSELIIIQSILPQILNSLDNNYNVNESVKKTILKQIDTVANTVDKIREKEGNHIKREFKYYIEQINKDIKYIESIKNEIVKRKKEKLSKMIKENEELIIEHILIYADKMDLSEEISRIKEHLKSIKKEHRGTTINFILQELLRETNTIGSKSDDIRVVKRVINMKETIEKIKEQVMNIE